MSRRRIIIALGTSRFVLNPLTASNETNPVFLFELDFLHAFIFQDKLKISRTIFELRYNFWKFVLFINMTASGFLSALDDF